MPRVSEAHLNARREQILRAAWRCFARDGFHRTSMQDIFAESGLSAGAVYRYFPSKNELVRATAENISAGVTEAYQSIAETEPVPPPDDVMYIVIDTLLQRAATDELDLTRIALHVWSEAQHDAEIKAMVRELGSTVLDHWSQIAERWQTAGYVARDANLDDVARLCYGMLVGFVLERHLVGNVTPLTYTAGLSALLQTPGRAGQVDTADQ